jgi:hypothetical protein
MFDLGLKRRRSSARVRSSPSRWVGHLEQLESRIALSNGLVGVPAESIQPLRLVTISAVPEDPGNTGVVPSTTVTVVGSVQDRSGAKISEIRTTLEIDAIENGTVIGSVSWDAAAGPGTITGPRYLGQDPAAQNRALFSLPLTLLSAAPAPQSVMFRITVVGSGTRNVVLRSNTSQPLTGTFKVVDAPPPIAALSSVATPPITPVSPVNVTSTTTVASTVSSAGVARNTTPPGSNVATVSAAAVKDSAGTGSQSVISIAQTPAVDTGPQIVGLQRYGVHGQPTVLVLTFVGQLDVRELNSGVGDLTNYLVYSPGRNGRLGTAHDVLDPIAGASYNAANNTVTLVLYRPLYLYGQSRIVVRGTGPNPITDLNGVPLDGAGNGTPGTDYVATFGREILAGPVPPVSSRPPTKPSIYQHYQVG